MRNAIVVKLKQNSSGRFPGAFYNEQKVREGLAELVRARNVDPLLLGRLETLRQMDMESGKELEEYMQKRAKGFDNSKSQRLQFHITISVRGRELDKEGLADLADRFMEAFGYGGQPYLVYFHHDTDNNHVHILSSNLDRFGRFIKDYRDKERMRRTMDSVLGITAEKQRERMLAFSFQTEGQFLNIARSHGFEPKREDVNGKDVYTLFRAGMPQMSIPLEKILGMCHSKGDAEDRARREKRISEIRAYFHKYRMESLKQQKETSSGKAKTKKEVVENNRKDAITTLKHKDGTPLSEQEQYHLRWFKQEVKDRFGLDIHFQKDRNGVVRGYGLVDMAGKMAFDGSQVMKLTEIIDYSGRQVKEESSSEHRQLQQQSHAATAGPSLSVPSGQLSQTHTCEGSQANTCEDSQTNSKGNEPSESVRQAGAVNHEYVHDINLDMFNGLFSASVTSSADGDFVTVRWQDGSSDSRPISAKQASWYSHAGSDTERQDIATMLTVSAFPQEVFCLMRDHYIREYENGRDITPFIDGERCSVIKHKDGHFMVRVFLNRVQGSRMFDLSREEADSFHRAVESKPEMERQLTVRLAARHLLEEDGQEYRRSLGYDAVFNPSRRGMKDGIARTVASAVRKVASASPGTREHTRAITRQINIAVRSIRSVLSYRGGSMYANREDELKKGKGYEDEIEDEYRMTY